jgi:predicted outer membrane repeat protein
MSNSMSAHNGNSSTSNGGAIGGPIVVNTNPFLMQLNVGKKI